MGGAILLLMFGEGVGEVSIAAETFHIVRGAFEVERIVNGETERYSIVIGK